MAKDKASQVPIADAIKNLRRELQAAIDEGDGKKLRFEVEAIDVELKCTVNREAQAEAGASFWVLNSKGGAKISNENVQTIRLTLNPKSNGEDSLLGGEDSFESNN